MSKQTPQNPSVAQVHRPNLALNKGNSHDASVAHIEGPAKTQKPIGYTAKG